MEEEEDNRLPVLDLALMVKRKTKKIKFTVHYKKTHTNITIKKNSNHRDSTKSGVIKRYVERARALCDKQYLDKDWKISGKYLKKMDTARKKYERRYTQRKRL